MPDKDNAINAKCQINLDVMKIIVTFVPILRKLEYEFT